MTSDTRLLRNRKVEQPNWLNLMVHYWLKIDVLYISQLIVEMWVKIREKSNENLARSSAKTRVLVGREWQGSQPST